MKNNKWFWSFIGLLVMVIIFFSWQQWETLTSAQSALTIQEARSIVKERYQGKVVRIKKIDNVYEIELAKENKHFEIKLDAKSREVISFRKLKDVAKSPEPHTPKELSEEQLKTKVLAETKGTILSFEKVEGEDEPAFEAVIQHEGNETTIRIGAVSGNVLSNNTKPIFAPPTSITEAQARQIAEREGFIDDIWSETRGDVTYYLAKVKTQAGENEKEDDD
jgi:uncharacterized membrane protein YkoI